MSASKNTAWLRICGLTVLIFGLTGCAGGVRSFVDNKWRKPVQMPAYYNLAIPENDPSTPENAQKSGDKKENQAQSAEIQSASKNPKDRGNSQQSNLVKRHQIPQYTLRVLREFESSAGASIADPRDQAKADRFLDHGMALTNLMCADFFSKLAQERQQRNYRRDYFSNINTGFSALLNLTKSSNLATGAASALFGSIDADYQNVDKHYVAAADLPAAEALVRRALAEQTRDNLKLTGLSYSQAENRLIQYANTCSFNGIKSLVNQSVLSGKVAVDSSGAAVVDGQSTALSKYDLAKSKQDEGFMRLGRCEWSKSADAFEEANKIYPQFQVSYDYSSVIRSMLQKNPGGIAAKMLELSRDQGVGRMPKDVQEKLEAGCPPLPAVAGAP